MGKADYVEEETIKLWKEVNSLKEKTATLKEEVSKKTSDFEADAKESALRSSEFRDKCKLDAGIIEQHLAETISKSEELRAKADLLTQLQSEINKYHNNIKNKNNSIENIHNEINNNKNDIDSKISKIDSIFQNHSTFVEKINKLEEIYSKSNDLSLKIQSLSTSIMSRKKEIDSLYYDIIGTTEKDNAGVETEIPGLKDELESAYNELESKADELTKKTSDIELHSELQYKNYREKKEIEIDGLLTNWKIEYSTISTKIANLLPDALTAGLSYAYHEKKAAEITESKTLSDRFIYAIIGLVAISLIPFCVSIYSLVTKVPLKDVLIDMPRLVLAILPLYIPVLWLAYSANKSLKLSKRLIEEYTHKEVLSKTFEGLSNQIEGIENKDISSELRIKLLYNILEVNSENPGKLITDYNKSDHPLMDALDKSFKLASAVDKLAEIPGLSKLAGILDKKAKHILEEKQKKADEGLNAVLQDEE